MATWLNKLRAQLVGIGNVATAFLIGAALTKIYYETSDTEKGKVSIQREIQEIESKHDNLKYGSHLRVISPQRQLGGDRAKSDAVGEVNAIEDDKIFKYGLPKRSPEYLRFKNHVLCYDQAKKTPRWVLEHLTKEKVKGEAERVHSAFKPDPNIPARFQSSNDDYWDSGWSRGHMAPASNSKYSQEAMDATFLLSNIVPQDLHNNSKFWYRLEAYCRSLTKRYSSVYIVSGPLYLPEDHDGKKIVSYEVIGLNNVAVPTHLFKAILAEDDDKGTVLGAFVVPNKPVSFDHKLQDFQVSFGDLEKYSGLVFFPYFDVGKAGDLCLSDGCKLLSKERMELISFGRRLRNSSSTECLETVWEEMKQNKVIPDGFTIDIYEKRKRQLQEEEMKHEGDL
ncbi:nuclease EXOG, mitochondrial-like [Montipora foliosa]|uniref:nuclease EXOG, mitochondrial-like n=1 Tax=Montipora foliosa TaxID=591990 RepID=UPI0035F1A8C7